MVAEIILACVLTFSADGAAVVTCASKADNFELAEVELEDGKAGYRFTITRESLEQAIDKARRRIRDDFRLKRRD